MREKQTVLAAREAVLSKGYQDEVLRASDGGQSTIRTKVYDVVRGTTGWAETHNARGRVNRTFEGAVRSVLYLVLTNTWRKFVDGSELSLDTLV